jgi:hypothetical protein
MNEGGARHLSFGQATLNIPFLDRKMLGIKYPDLDSKDGEIHARAWRKFNKSREADPYRLTKKRLFNGFDSAKDRDSVILTPD